MRGVLFVISSFILLSGATDDEQVNGLDLTQHRENAYPDFELNETVAIYISERFLLMNNLKQQKPDLCPAFNRQ